MDEIYVRLGKNLRDRRTRKGLTQQEVAERAGITPAFLSYLEAGNRKGSLDTYHRVAEALGVGLRDLFGGQPSAESNAPMASVGLEGLRLAERKAVYRLVRALRSRRQ